MNKYQVTNGSNIFEIRAKNMQEARILCVNYCDCSQAITVTPLN